MAITANAGTWGAAGGGLPGDTNDDGVLTYVYRWGTGLEIS